MSPSQIVLCKPYPGCERFDAIMASGQKVHIKPLSPERRAAKAADKAARIARQHAQWMHEGEKKRESFYGTAAGIPYLDELFRINRDAIIAKLSFEQYTQALIEDRL